jgi:hypothetical protein
MRTWRRGEELALGLARVGRLGLPLGRRAQGEEGRGSQGFVGEGGWHVTPSRHARPAGAAWQGERPVHREETALKRTSDFSHEIWHTWPGEQVRFCMPSGDPGGGVG